MNWKKLLSKTLSIITVAILTVTTVEAQIYHEDCKEDLREIMRQGTNYEKLGLELQDTLTWYQNEEWVKKITGTQDLQFYRGVSWRETEALKRIDTFSFRSVGLEGKLKLSSPVLLCLRCWDNHLTELDVSNNINLCTLECGSNNLVELDISKNTKLTRLFCYNNNFTELDLSNNPILDWLSCADNNLTELDLSKNLELRILEFTSNNLSQIDLSNNLKLEWLYCIDNNLTELDLSKNLELESLYCIDNNLTELDVTKNSKLRNLNCDNNKLAKLNVVENYQISISCRFNLLKFSTLPTINTWYSYSPQGTIKGGTKKYTDTVNLSSEYNVNGNITTFEWFDITTYTEKPITQPTNTNGVFSFTVEHAEKRLRCKMTNALFPYLTLIYEVNTGETFPQVFHEDCKEDLRAILRQGGNLRRMVGLYTGLSATDTLYWYDDESWVEKVYGLSWIEIGALKRIDSVNWFNYDNMPGGSRSLVGKIKFSSPFLKYLVYTGNYNTELDVSDNTALTYLNCFANRLSELDLSKNTELIYLDCSGNNLTELDLSNNIKLAYLDCNNNKLTELNVGDIPLLELYCGDNNLSELDVSKNIELQHLSCSGNNLEKLDVNKNINLEKLDCNSNKLFIAGLNLGDIGITELSCNYNNLTELDITKNIRLCTLNCSNNNFISLDLSNNIDLKHLTCDNSNLIELDISKNINLDWLYCGWNNLTTLNISNNLKLKYLWCNNNNLTEFIVGNNSLQGLTCDNNKLKFSTLPLPTISVYYWFAPQDTIDGGTQSYTVDLSSEYNINGHITHYEWFDITNGTEQAITQPTNTNGVFSFTVEHTEKRLRCKMRNASFATTSAQESFVLVYEVEIKETSIDAEPEMIFFISPNPAQTQLTIHHSNAISSIFLYDVSGKLIRTYTVENINPTLDISDLDSGVYFITVDGKSVKLIKQ